MSSRQRRRPRRRRRRFRETEMKPQRGIVTMCSELRRLGFASGRRAGLYGGEFEFVSDPEVDNSGYCLKAISHKFWPRPQRTHSSISRADGGARDFSWSRRLTSAARLESSVGRGSYEHSAYSLTEGESRSPAWNNSSVSRATSSTNLGKVASTVAEIVSPWSKHSPPSEMTYACGALP
jgi:hypothetical protein